MANKNKTQDPEDQSAPEFAARTRRLGQARGLAVLVFLLASAVLFADISGMALFGLEQRLSGVVLFAVPTQFLAVALADVANGRLRQVDIDRIRAEEAGFREATAQRTDAVSRKVDDHLQVVLEKLFAERDALKGEVEAMKDAEKQRVADQLAALSTRNEELERKLREMQSKEGEAGDGGAKIYAA